MRTEHEYEPERNPDGSVTGACVGCLADQERERLSQIAEVTGHRIDGVYSLEWPDDARYALCSREFLDEMVADLNWLGAEKERLTRLVIEVAEELAEHLRSNPATAQLAHASCIIALATGGPDGDIQRANDLISGGRTLPAGVETRHVEPPSVASSPEVAT